MTTELNIHNDELDSDPLSTRVEAFRTLLRSRHDESEKLQACADMRDRLLEEQKELAVLVTDIEEVMVAECVLYKKLDYVYIISSCLRPHPDCVRRRKGFP